MPKNKINPRERPEECIQPVYTGPYNEENELDPRAYVCMFSDLSKGFGGFNGMGPLAECPLETGAPMLQRHVGPGWCLGGAGMLRSLLPPHLATGGTLKRTEVTI